MPQVCTGMKPIQELRQDMSLIRRQGGKVFTNYYNQCADCTEPLQSWQTPKALAFQWIDDGIRRIYFYAIDQNECMDVVACAEKGSSIDYITNNKEESNSLFIKAGYRLHMEYGRFCIRTPSKETLEFRTALQESEWWEESVPDSPYGEKAQVSDAEEIDRQLREEFDPYEAHFYSLDKLRDCIRKGWVWVAKEDGKIIAASLFEVQGCKLYGAYLYNHGDVDVLSSLDAKVSEYVAKLGVKYSYFWMRLNNKRIIRYNMMVNGSVPDGVYNMIYVKE